MNMTSFFEFIQARYEEESKKIQPNCIFDIALDAKGDLLYPRENNNRHFLRVYLASQNASARCLECFEKAFNEFEFRGGVTFGD